MRTALLATLVALVGLAGCSLARGGHTDRGVPLVHPAPARAWHRTGGERLALHELAPLASGETRRPAIGSLDADARTRAFVPPAAAPLPQDADPIRGAFDALPEGHRWSPEAFLPSGGTLDLLHHGDGRLYMRAWDRDRDFRGGGVGWTLPLGAGWHAAAELGVDPRRRPDAGGTALVAGFGLRL